MNRELHHPQRDDGSGEYRENQPSRDALVPISQLPDVRGKARLRGDSALGFFSIGVELRYFIGFRHELGNLISIVVFHGADVITGNSRSDVRKSGRGLTGIAASRK
jgi:hypothetical protein